MADIKASEVHAALRALLRYSKSLTRNANPIEYMRGNVSFVDMMADEQTSGFGQWMHACGFNTALVMIECQIQEYIKTVEGFMDEPPEEVQE